MTSPVSAEGPSLTSEDSLRASSDTEDLTATLSKDVLFSVSEEEEDSKEEREEGRREGRRERKTGENGEEGEEGRGGGKRGGGRKGEEGEEEGRGRKREEEGDKSERPLHVYLSILCSLFMLNSYLN